MKKIATLFTLALALSAHAKPIKVFILDGQSKMQGQGVVSMDGEKDYNGGKGNLVWSTKNSKSAAKLKPLQNDKGEWIVIGDALGEGMKSLLK